MIGSQSGVVSGGSVENLSNKKCQACKKFKNFTEFPKNKFSPSGINPYCKDCVDRKHNKYGKKSPAD